MNLLKRTSPQRRPVRLGPPGGATLARVEIATELVNPAMIPLIFQCRARAPVLRVGARRGRAIPPAGNLRAKARRRHPPARSIAAGADVQRPGSSNSTSAIDRPAAEFAK